MTPLEGPADELAQLAAQGLLRKLRALPRPGGKFERDGRIILNFSSNDYLDLANDQRLKDAAALAIEKYGTGAGASRLMSGHLDIHAKLESRLAAFLSRPAALVFGSGFLTNLAVLTTLAGRSDAIFADRLNHASLIDGARLSGAKVFRFRHADASHLEELLEKHSNYRRRLIASDSLFSMDGDLAPLDDLADLARKHSATLVIDEAHAIGVLGPAGRGACASLNPERQPQVVIATFSKALGSYGGFVATDEATRDLLINRARSFIYSTALPPASLAAAEAALDIIEADPSLADTLAERARIFRELLAACGLDTGPSVSHIIPITVGDNDTALKLSAALLEDGILAVAIRPPTVPEGTARLRLSITLAQTAPDLQRAADTIAAHARKLGVAK